ncbi:hypothetical protein N7478_012173 [Penicillium angulare]|uniref:uncharacterized protein n=1 Tax=Penicillium angulare TaxID=116970 RepID=UPI002542049D|nr:uncharacterized protein N7478_012173 [Penicillium angulare]KAJ5260568.1 hypothetical protein N7478_012173 [Penicillium angulare]
MPGNGYLVIAFENDNPGSWLMHCHIAWHSSQSLALQFIERSKEIPKLVEPVALGFQKMCQTWDSYYNRSQYQQDDSGI